MINQGEGRFEDIQGDWRYPAGDVAFISETHSIPTLGDFDNDGILVWPSVPFMTASTLLGKWRRF